MKRHNNSVYDGVAVRNVARQIDELYWQSTNPEDPLYGEDNDEVLRQGDDLTRNEYVLDFSLLCFTHKELISSQKHGEASLYAPG